MIPYINIGTSTTRIGVKIVFSADGNISVYTDPGVTGTYYLQYYGSSNIVNYTKPQYLYLVCYNSSSTSYTGLLEEVLTYRYADISSLPNIMMMPPNATLETAE